MKICYLCKEPISQGQRVEFHHPIYKSRGGQQTVPTHKACHRNFHSENGDFETWGRIGGSISASSCAWSFNLKNVRNNLAFALERAYYLVYYAKGGAR